MEDYSCEMCRYAKKCEESNGIKRPYGDDYRALIGTHFCRRSWDQFTCCYNKLSVEDKIMKLFLVECRGMKTSIVGTPHGIAYVLEEDPTKAYNKLKKFLDDNDFGYPHERELDKITLIADSTNYPNCRTKLVL
jgi:hypothetical protein